MLHELASQTPDQLSILLHAAYNLDGLVDRASPARLELDDVLARFRRINGHPDPYGVCCPFCGDVPRPNVAKEILADRKVASVWLSNHCWSKHFECQVCLKKLKAAEEARKRAAVRDGKDVGPAKGQRAPRYGTWSDFLGHLRTQHKSANMW